MLKMLDICFGVYTLITLGKAGMDFKVIEYILCLTYHCDIFMKSIKVLHFS